MIPDMRTQKLFFSFRSRLYLEETIMLHFNFTRVYIIKYCNFYGMFMAYIFR